MKKLLLLMVITLLLAACGQTKGQVIQTAIKKQSQLIKNMNYVKDGRDAEQKEEKVKVTKDPKKSSHLITVQQISLKHSEKNVWYFNWFKRLYAT